MNRQCSNIGPRHILALCRHSYRRRGVAVIEGLVVLATFLFLLFMCLDVGLAVHRWNTLSEAARRLARSTIVRGVTSQDSAWGPVNVASTADDGSEYADVMLPVLGASNESAVQFQIEWLDGTNEIDDRVRITVRQWYDPVLPWLGNQIELTAGTTMRIVH